ncbi:MAG: hypothetical protein AAFR21_13230 [Pseudomonadota bacterium]
MTLDFFRLNIVLFFATLIVGFSPAIAEDTGTNPFERFKGVWGLKDDRFQQVWDGKTVETLSIPGHRTDCDRINTDKSALCVVDAGDFEGHILWAFNDRTQSFEHLSHFGTSRLGRGVGQILPNGDLRIKIEFSDEPEGSYRLYEYNWVSENEYDMISRQFDEADRPTGNWYGGSFVRE